MHSILKAISFLHEHKIFHCDIKTQNFLFNFLPNSRTHLLSMDPVYNPLRYQKRLCYAIIDFGLLIKFPDNYSPLQCRLPCQEFWCGTTFLLDTWQGEFNFDPFAYDVGVLGITFASHFQPFTPLAPMLAPLIDKMVTRDVKSRFTASQALQFFEDMYPDVMEEQLSTVLPLNRDSENYETHDRWVGLPLEFLKKWSKVSRTTLTTLNEGPSRYLHFLSEATRCSMLGKEGLSFD